MGRGNVCVHYECEGVYYIDKELVSDEKDDFLTCELYREMIETIQFNIKKRFPSFSCENKWDRSFINSDRYVVLENSLFQIAVVDNEWSYAWCLLERRDVDDVGYNRTLMRRNYKKYLESIKNILVSEWGECFGYGGAWTHGERFTHPAITKN